MSTTAKKDNLCLIVQLENKFDGRNLYVDVVVSVGRRHLQSKVLLLGWQRRFGDFLVERLHWLVDALLVRRSVLVVEADVAGAHNHYINVKLLLEAVAELAQR